MDTQTGSRHPWRLTNGQDTWSARCVETRTPGAAGGPGKPTGSNPDRAPRSDQPSRHIQLGVVLFDERIITVWDRGA